MKKSYNTLMKEMVESDDFSLPTFEEYQKENPNATVAEWHDFCDDLAVQLFS